MPKFNIGDSVFVCCYKGIIIPKAKATIIKIIPDTYHGNFYELNLRDDYNTWLRIEERFLTTN